ncbi:MAG: rRNA maturation RNase YbeY [Gammaproteobacteria bacterium]|nr:rRNA maturation RNase YbeY [Gammaproteobacteria bacterium]
MVNIDLQNESGYESIPDVEQILLWVKTALQNDNCDLEQTIRVVGEDEIRSLNSQYRGKDTVTNILSFSAEMPHIDYQYLGDLVICTPVVIAEARQQAKDANAHWAHLIVHGMLHLQGLDHENEPEAAKMEALEVKILSTMGYSNPYNNE